MKFCCRSSIAEEEDWEAEDDEAIGRASLAMSADAMARAQVWAFQASNQGMKGQGSSSVIDRKGLKVIRTSRVSSEASDTPCWVEGMGEMCSCAKVADD